VIQNAARERACCWVSDPPRAPRASARASLVDGAHGGARSAPSGKRQRAARRGKPAEGRSGPGRAAGNRAPAPCHDRGPGPRQGTAARSLAASRLRAAVDPS
jgi:hypothetical protein